MHLIKANYSEQKVELVEKDVNHKPHQVNGICILQAVVDSDQQKLGLEKIEINYNPLKY
ncbi:MAG: hypothetical protein F6J98_21380 [Moorea sp. SIO4G2]|nr:hypothetical protein [Moorena sp. SIO4G2]